MMVFWWWLACRQGEPSPLAFEPLDLPADASAFGVPVGVRTVSVGALDVEVWYPAAEATQGAVEVVDFADAVPASVTDRLGPLDIPLIPTRAVRDAPMRRLEALSPVIIFSHGFGGTRHQSVDLTVHLASRGYVVLATDHRGRAFQDLLPCLFSPAAEGCDLSAFGADPGPADVADMLDWLEDDGGVFGGVVDLGRIGITGHSAGGGTSAAVVEADPRVIAAAPMAGTGPVSRDVPVLNLAGDCDGIVGLEGIAAASQASASASLSVFPGAGHLAFSDLCTLDLAGLAATYLEGRDDLNALLYDGLVQLGSDGCPGAAPTVPSCDAFAPLAPDQARVRAELTDFFDASL